MPLNENVDFELRRVLHRFRHDVATPLSGALLHLEIASRRLKGSSGPIQEARESVEMIRVELERIAAILDGLDATLDLAGGETS